jgi:hypothetical protein
MYFRLQDIECPAVGIVGHAPDAAVARQQVDGIALMEAMVA